MDLPVTNFLKTISPRDRIFYILMRSYERDLNYMAKQHHQNHDHFREKLHGIIDLYESELLNVIKSGEGTGCDKNTESPLESNTDQYGREASIGPQFQPVFLDSETQAPDEFEDILGPWVLSSDDDECYQDTVDGDNS